MNISKKIKAINNKIEQNKAQYDLDRKTAKISKAAAVKRFEYSPLGKDLKKQTSVAEK